MSGGGYRSIPWTSAICYQLKILNKAKASPLTRWISVRNSLCPSSVASSYIEYVLSRFWNGAVKEFVLLSGVEY